AGAAGNFLASINQLSVNAFKSVIEIDVIGSFNTLKATLPYLVEFSALLYRGYTEDSTERLVKPNVAGTGGRIVFISATLHYRTTPFQAHVSAAKAGIDALSHTVSIEFGPLGVTSNIISPGPIAGTEGMDRLLPSDTKKEYVRSLPLGRMGSVRDIADASLYLFADSGSYVNGQVLVVDGASWRMGSGSFGDLKYPDFLLAGDPVKNVKGGKSKL
ncbi:peroxisomal 2 4-dienoyl-CoA reductase sps19, partial [Elasticomyces elasticus]